MQKAPLLPLEAEFPLDLVHINFTTIETTMELDKPLKVVNVLVMQDHFMRYIIAFVTPDQKARTVAQTLYQGYLSIFGSPKRLLSDQG